MVRSGTLMVRFRFGAVRCGSLTFQRAILYISGSRCAWWQKTTNRHTYDNYSNPRSIDKPLTFDIGLIQLSYIPVCSPNTCNISVKLRRGFAL